MNDGINDINDDTLGGTDIPEDAGDSGETGSDTQSNESIDNSGDAVFDSMGSDNNGVSDSEAVQEIIENDSLDSEESGVETSGGSETYYTETGAVDYTPELEYIDYLLNQQLTELNAVQTVSGNSVLVSFDDTSAQLLVDIQTGQETIIEGQTALFGLVSCVLMVICIDYFTASARRVVKKMFNRKGE